MRAGPPRSRGNTGKGQTHELGAHHGAADAFQGDAGDFEEHDGDALAFADEGEEEVDRPDL